MIFSGLAPDQWVDVGIALLIVVLAITVVGVLCAGAHLGSDRSTHEIEAG